MSEIKFNNLELRKNIRAIVPNIDDLQLDLIEISVIHLVDVYVKAKFNQQQKEIERYENAIKECIDRMNEGGAGTRSFVYEKLKEVMGGTE